MDARMSRYFVICTTSSALFPSVEHHLHGFKTLWAAKRAARQLRKCYKALHVEVRDTQTLDKAGFAKVVFQID